MLITNDLLCDLEVEQMVTHVMSDGTRRDSIAGLVIPAGHPIYKLLKKEIQKQREGLNDTNRSNKQISGENNERNII